MTTIDAYQESADSTTTYLDYYDEVSYPFFEDPALLPFYDTPQPSPYKSTYFRPIKKKQKILDHRAKY